MCCTTAQTNCNNIRAVYQNALPYLRGVDWYETAHLWAVDTAQRLGYTVEQVVGATAAVSPQVEWETNKLMVENLDWSGAYGSNAVKADLILSGADPDDVLGGPKVRAFYRAILAPLAYNDAIVDRHTISIWLGHRASPEERRFYGRPYRITDIQSCFSRVAWEVGLLPHQLQATCWVEWKSQ